MRKLSRREFLLGAGTILLAGCASQAVPATETKELTPTAKDLDTLGDLIAEATRTSTAVPTAQPTEVEKTATPNAKEALTTTPGAETAIKIDFEDKYPEKWSKEFTGVVAGQRIPIKTILDDSVVVAKGIGISQPAADGVAEFFIKASHYRYVKENNLTLTYQDFLRQVFLRNMKVPIVARGTKISDNTLKSRVFDPALGINFILTSRDLPISQPGGNWFDFQVDGNNKLTIATELSAKVLDRQKNAPYSQQVVDSVIVGDLLIGSMRNIAEGLRIDTCAKSENITGVCVNYHSELSKEFWQASDSLGKLFVLFRDGKLDEAPFSIVR